MTAGVRMVYGAPQYLEPLLLVRGDQVALPRGQVVTGRWATFLHAQGCTAGHGPRCTVLVLSAPHVVHTDSASLLWCRTPRAAI